MTEDERARSGSVLVLLYRNYTKYQDFIHIYLYENV